MTWSGWFTPTIAPAPFLDGIIHGRIDPAEAGAPSPMISHALAANTDRNPGCGLRNSICDPS
jgi:hypothetical protein